MYGINLESENEKKTKTNTHQIQSIRRGSKRPGGTRYSRDRPNARTAWGTHGMTPTMNTGTRETTTTARCDARWE